MDDFQIDARQWGFLNAPHRYLEHGTGSLKILPLIRQFNTAKEILARLANGRGVLLADDVGLGKTAVGAIVAWVVACQGKRVRIYAPNKVLRRRWAEELERHVPMLNKIGVDASHKHIKQGDVERLHAGRIQISTHHALVKSHGDGGQRSECDLMIVDEAHRAKGDGSAFSKALHNLGGRAKRKLILTATPFSIRLTELEQLLTFVGASRLDAVRHYAYEMKRLYTLGGGHDVTVESKRLLEAAKAAIDELQPYLIRHGIDALSRAEREHFGAIGAIQWNITTPPASTEDIQFLLRMDRLLQLTPKRQGERRNDPRFHLGWQHLGTELERAFERCNGQDNPTASRHIKEAEKSLTTRRANLHPKIAAVSEAIRPLIDAREKVLLFCHHRATASELLIGLEQSLKAESIYCAGPPKDVWREAWVSVLGIDKSDTLLRIPIIDWLCTDGIRRQVIEWLINPAPNPRDLADQLSKSRPRKASASVATIAEAALKLVTTLLDRHSTSTRAVLRSIAKRGDTFGGKRSHFPGQLDAGLRVMGFWDHDGTGNPPSSLYTGKPDILLAIFNSPFGPDVLVTTDRLSEGVDLHRYCRHLIHYELDPSPVRTLQRNGRIRRVDSWAALTKKPICYAYPTFGGTRDEKAVDVMRQRINAFGMLLGGVPFLDNGASDSEQHFAEAVLHRVRTSLESLNRKLAVQEVLVSPDYDKVSGKSGESV
jgi:hypothetical protein